MDEEERARKSGRAFTIGLAIYAAVTVVLAATTAHDRFVTHTPYNHFALLADAWAHGRLDLGGPPPIYTGNNDFAFWEGKYFISFPPFPAVLLLPLVWAAGSAEKVRDGLFFLGFAGVGPSVLFLALQKLTATGRSRRTELENAALAVLFALGTVYWFSAVQGTVWFAAHVVGVGLACLYLLFSIDADYPELAGLVLALGFGTRAALGFAAPLFLYEAVRRSRRTDVGLEGLVLRLARFAVPAALVLAVLFWHNQRRFGDPFEFGHKLLTVGWRGRIDRWGLTSYHYLGRNLAVAFTSVPFTGVPGTPFQINMHGLALWITTPIYAWALWPKRTSGLTWALALTALCVATPALLYQNSGWMQFGYRFSNDFAPFLFALVAIGGRRLSPPFWLLAAVGVVVNAFGAVTFERAGYERFYFVDGSQKILHQPD